MVRSGPHVRILGKSPAVCWPRGEGGVRDRSSPCASAHSFTSLRTKSILCSEETYMGNYGSQAFKEAAWAGGPMCWLQLLPWRNFPLPSSYSNTTATNCLLAIIHSPLLLNNRTSVLLHTAMSPAKGQHFQPPLPI